MAWHQLLTGAKGAQNQPMRAREMPGANAQPSSSRVFRLQREGAAQAVALQYRENKCHARVREEKLSRLVPPSGVSMQWEVGGVYRAGV